MDWIDNIKDDLLKKAIKETVESVPTITIELKTGERRIFRENVWINVEEVAWFTFNSNTFTAIQHNQNIIAIKKKMSNNG